MVVVKGDLYSTLVCAHTSILSLMFILGLHCCGVRPKIFDNKTFKILERTKKQVTDFCILALWRYFHPRRQSYHAKPTLTLRLEIEPPLVFLSRWNYHTYCSPSLSPKAAYIKIYYFTVEYFLKTKKHQYGSARKGADYHSFFPFSIPFFFVFNYSCANVLIRPPIWKSTVAISMQVIIPSNSS